MGKILASHTFVYSVPYKVVCFCMLLLYVHVELLDSCPYVLGMALGAVQSSVKCLLSTSGSAIKSQHPSSCAAAPCEIPAILEASTREGCHIQHRETCTFFFVLTFSLQRRKAWAGGFLVRSKM